jgi:hypothetical protein
MRWSECRLRRPALREGTCPPCGQRVVVLLLPAALFHQGHPTYRAGAAVERGSGG